MDNQYQYKHGIYLGYINNTNKGKDIESNEFLKNKTIGTITNYILVGGNDEPQQENKKSRHYMGLNFNSFYDAMRWAIKSNNNVKWLVLFEAGTIIDKGHILNFWLNSLPYANDTNIGAYAHILMPESMEWLDINTQMVAINVEVIRKFKQDIFKLINYKGKMEIKCERSLASYHDDYTPYWVIPNTTFSKNYNINVTERSAWLAFLIQNGYSVSNFSTDTIRSCKQFFYMDTPEQLQLAKSYMKGEEKSSLLKAAKDIDKLGVMESFLKQDAKNIIGCLVQNTSNFPYRWDSKEKVDAIVIPCAGLNFYKCFDSVPTSNKLKFFHYDISKISVEFRKKVITKWDGNDYYDFVQTIIPKGQETLYHLNKKMSIDSISESDWNEIQKVDHDFIQLDLITNWKEILESLKDRNCKNIIFDLSNILSYAHTTYKYGYNIPTQVFKDIINYLQINFDNWVINTDYLTLSNKDIDNYNNNEIGTTENESLRKYNSAFGYLIHKAKPYIPNHPVLKVWESASVDFSLLMSEINHNRFDKQTKTAVLSTNKTEWNDFYSESYLPAIELDLPFDHETMLKEVQLAYDNGLFSYHRNEGDSGWCSFVINGLGHGKTKSFESYYPDKKESSDYYSITDEARKYTPTIVHFFENIFPEITNGISAFNRVRIMGLEPGGVIFPHYDSVNSTCPSPINMAINNPKNCHFHMWKGSNFTPNNYYGVIPFKAGKSFNLDIGNSHTIYNLSSEVRFHMIAHIDWNNEETKNAWYEFRNKNLLRTINKFR